MNYVFLFQMPRKSIWIKLETTVKSHGHGSVPSSKQLIEYY